MRPSLIFLGLFSILMLIYFALSTFVQASHIFLLQLALILVLLVITRWFRHRNN